MRYRHGAYWKGKYRHGDRHHAPYWAQRPRTGDQGDNGDYGWWYGVPSTKGRRAPVKWNPSEPPGPKPWGDKKPNEHYKEDWKEAYG